MEVEVGGSGGMIDITRDEGFQDDFQDDLTYS